MTAARDPLDYRSALGTFATGVTVITTVSESGEPVGFTANSLSSVSLEPPLLLFCLDRGSYSFNHFETAKHFAVNVLTELQENISAHFARPSEDKWRHVGYELCSVGCPVFAETLALFECRTHAVHDGGDHIIVVGEVVRFAHEAEGDPLLYYRGRYARIAPEGDPDTAGR